MKTSDQKLGSVEHYLDRDISWLRFNERVLYQAEEARTPLLERVRFLNIFQNNLNEFYMKRVGGLLQKKMSNLPIVSATTGLMAGDRLDNIRSTVSELNCRIERLLREELLPGLNEKGIRLHTWETINQEQQDWCEKFFRQKIYPVATPMVVDQGHPFPLLSNLSSSIAAKIRHPNDSEPLFARVKVPRLFTEWIQIEEGGVKGEHHFIHLLDVVEEFLPELFPRMDIMAVMPFKVTRNADIETDEDDADDLLDLIQVELRNRKFSEIVRLEHGPHPDPWLLNFLKDHLDLGEEEVVEFPMHLRYRDLDPIPDLKIPELRTAPWTPVNPNVFNQEEEFSVFSAIRSGDILVHHPYESFTATVEHFIRSAARDPQVITIKLTLYRTNRDSAIVKSLIEAANHGKQVVCLVEIKARFDEERNIYWAQEMEKAGVHVIYGMVGLKIHSKVASVVRKEGNEFRLYSHLGTGNYNSTTANLYTDVGLFTCNPAITSEVVDVFHFLTGRSLKSDYKMLLVSPMNMKDRFLELIRTEAANAQAGKPSGIVAKMNSLEDRDVIDALYGASKAGVPITLIVRGFCCLRPQVPQLSENIRVVSIIGPLLEHARLFFFRGGESDPENGLFYLGSGDWMYRNLLSRVEVAAPVVESGLKKRLWQILNLQMQDNRLAWDMAADGSYHRRLPKAGEPEVNSQLGFMEVARHRLTLASDSEAVNTTADTTSSRTTGKSSSTH